MHCGNGDDDDDGKSRVCAHIAFSNRPLKCSIGGNQHCVVGDARAAITIYLMVWIWIEIKSVVLSILDAEKCYVCVIWHVCEK